MNCLRYGVLIKFKVIRAPEVIILHAVWNLHGNSFTGWWHTKHAAKRRNVGSNRQVYTPLEIDFSLYFSFSFSLSLFLRKLWGVLRLTPKSLRQREIWEGEEQLIRRINSDALPPRVTVCFGALPSLWCSSKIPLFIFSSARHTHLCVTHRAEN